MYYFLENEKNRMKLEIGNWHRTRLARLPSEIGIFPPPISPHLADPPMAENNLIINLA